MQRINKQLEILQKQGYTVKTQSNTNWIVIIRGPPQTPYENGKYQIDIRIPEGFPFSSPKVSIKTAIFHPNIDPKGDICQEMFSLGQHWKPNYKIVEVIQKIVSLMIKPNPSGAILNQQARCENYLKTSKWWQVAKERNAKYAK